MAERSSIVKVNVTNRAELCPLLQAWGGLFWGKTERSFLKPLRKVKKRTVEIMNKIFQQSSVNLNTKLC